MTTAKSAINDTHATKINMKNFEDADGSLARLICKVVRESQEHGVAIEVARKVLTALANELAKNAEMADKDAISLVTPALPEPYQPAGEDAGCWFPDFFVASQMHEFGKEYVRLNMAVTNVTGK